MAISLQYSMRLKYGKGSVDIALPEKHILGVIEADPVPAQPIKDVLKASVMNSFGKEPLPIIMRNNRPGDVVIIVSDQSRSIANYPQILEFLVSELIDGGIDEKNIEFLVACGTHEPHDQAINEKKYGNIARNFNIISHNCVGEMKRVGKTATGLEVLINRRAGEAAALFGWDYIVNVVENIDNETNNIFWGDPNIAFKNGVAEFYKQRSKAVSELA